MVTAERLPGLSRGSISLPGVLTSERAEARSVKTVNAGVRINNLWTQGYYKVSYNKLWTFEVGAGITQLTER